jgi:hypothetical protein
MTFDPIRDWKNKRQAQRDAAETDARARHNEQVKARARLSYLTAGGDEQSFKEEWPTLQKELLRDETIRTVRGDNK